MKFHRSGRGFSGYPEQFLAVFRQFTQGTSVTESIALAPPPPILPPPLHPRRGGGMIPPHIESIPSLLVIKVHKVVLSVVHHVVLFFGLRGMQRGAQWKEKRRGIGARVYSRQRGT